MILQPEIQGLLRRSALCLRDYRDKRSYRLSEDKWLVHEDDRVPAIVPEAMWDEANRLLGRTRTDHEAARAGIAEPLCLQRQAHLREARHRFPQACV